MKMFIKALMLLQGLFCYQFVDGQNNNTLVIAHRGASGYQTENTLSAVRKAIELDAHAIEVDIWRTVDDSLVVFHDMHTKRLANDSLVVPQSTYAQLRSLKLPGGEYIPTLREVLEIIPQHIGIVVEIKCCWQPGKAGNVFPLLSNVLAQTGTIDRATIISFNMANCSQSKQYLPNAPFYYLTYIKESPRKLVKRAKRAGADGINVNFGLLNNKLVQQSHKAGLKFLVWTVNNEKMLMDILSKYPLDGITSDYPDLVKQVLESSSRD